MSTSLFSVNASVIAVISIEPVPDNSPNPFTLKPLVTAISDPGGAGIPQTMGNNATASNQSGGVFVVQSIIQAQAVPSLKFWGMLILLMVMGLGSFRQFKSRI